MMLNHLRKQVNSKKIRILESRSNLLNADRKHAEPRMVLRPLGRRGVYCTSKGKLDSEVLPVTGSFSLTASA